MLGSFRAAVAKARRDRSLLFAALLSEESILEAFGPARWLWQGWVYTPAVTVWTQLFQAPFYSLEAAGSHAGTSGHTGRLFDIGQPVNKELRPLLFPSCAAGLSLSEPPQ